jgi:hypothetical protein
MIFDMISTSSQGTVTVTNFHQSVLVILIPILQFYSENIVLNLIIAISSFPTKIIGLQSSLQYNN